MGAIFGAILFGGILLWCLYLFGIVDAIKDKADDAHREAKRKHGQDAENPMQGWWIAGLILVLAGGYGMSECSKAQDEKHPPRSPSIYEEEYIPGQWDNPGFRQ